MWSLRELQPLPPSGVEKRSLGDFVETPRSAASENEDTGSPSRWVKKPIREEQRQVQLRTLLRHHVV